MARRLLLAGGKQEGQNDLPPESVPSPHSQPAVPVALAPAATSPAASGTKPDGGKTRLVMSKQWVLPPRPKPGRKPKIRTNTPVRDHKDAPSNISKQERKFPKATSIIANKANADDDCGLCDHESGCLCSDIGLKKSTSSPSPGNPQVKGSFHSPRLELILESVPVMPAVPLKQYSGPPALPKKFKRADSLSSSMPAVVDSVDGCGFCREGTPCVCAAPPEPPHYQSELFENAPAKELKKEVNEQKPDITGVLEDTTSDLPEACRECQKSAMSMLFCLSLGSSKPVQSSAIAIPCYLAYRTLEKHPKFATADLGGIVSSLEVDQSKSPKLVGVQSINSVLQSLSQNELTL